MGLYVDVVPVDYQKELGERETTPTSFVLKAVRAMVSQDELECTAEALGIPLPLVYHDRETAEQNASLLSKWLDEEWRRKQALLRREYHWSGIW